MKLLSYEQKQKIVRTYVKWDNYLATGMGLIYNPIKIVQYVLGFSIFLKLFIDPQAIYYLYANVGLGVLMLIFSLTAGKWWDNIRGYHIRAEWANERNPFIEKIMKEIKGLKKQTEVKGK